MCHCMLSRVCCVLIAVSYYLCYVASAAQSVTEGSGSQWKASRIRGTDNATDSREEPVHSRSQFYGVDDVTISGVFLVTEFNVIKTFVIVELLHDDTAIAFVHLMCLFWGTTMHWFSVSLISLFWPYLRHNQTV